MSTYHKCVLCGEQIWSHGREETYLGKRQYAHTSCAEFKNACAARVKLNDTKFKKQLAQMISSGRTIEGLDASLRYWYDVRQESNEKANGGIAILDYVYDEAQQYFEEKKAKKLAANRITESEKEAYKELWNNPVKKTQKPIPFRRPIGVKYIDLD